MGQCFHFIEGIWPLEVRWLSWVSMWAGDRANGVYSWFTSQSQGEPYPPERMVQRIMGTITGAYWVPGPLVLLMRLFPVTGSQLAKQDQRL